MGRYLIPILIGVLLLIIVLSFFNSKQINNIFTKKIPPSTSRQVTLTIDGVFEGITPCSAITRPLPQVPTNANCEMAIWKVTFNPDSTYSLTAFYGMSQPGTTGIRGGGTRVNMNGNWVISEGILTDPKAVVIELNTDRPQNSISFLKVNGNIIHLLGTDKSMIIGNGAWPYTLNRTNGFQPNDATLPSISADSPITGVFEGRTVCKDFLIEFAQQPKAGCDKIKWKLTLNPTRYHLLTSRGSSEGVWTMDGNILQLKSDKTQQTISLLRVDDNHLFFLDKNMYLLIGNALWSYTLSRTN